VDEYADDDEGRDDNNLFGTEATFSAQSTTTQTFTWMILEIKEWEAKECKSQDAPEGGPQADTKTTSC
jgi:hypothetical protein